MSIISILYINSTSEHKSEHTDHCFTNWHTLKFIPCLTGPPPQPAMTKFTLLSWKINSSGWILSLALLYARQHFVFLGSVRHDRILLLYRTQKAKQNNEYLFCKLAFLTAQICSRLETFTPSVGPLLLYPSIRPRKQLEMIWKVSSSPQHPWRRKVMSCRFGKVSVLFQPLTTPSTSPRTILKT